MYSEICLTLQKNTKLFILEELGPKTPESCWSLQSTTHLCPTFDPCLGDLCGRVILNVLVILTFVDPDGTVKFSLVLCFVSAVLFGHEIGI